MPSSGPPATDTDPAPVTSRRRLLATLGAAAAASIAGCTASVPDDDPTGEWRTPGADAARTGYRPDVRGPADLDGGWTVRLPERGATADTPVVRDGTVYATYRDPDDGFRGPASSMVGAYDAATGEHEWTAEAAHVDAETQGEPHTDGLVAGDRGLYLQTGVGLVALENDGRERWTVDNAGSAMARFALAHPAVSDGIVYAASYDADDEAAVLRAYGADDGGRLWSAPTGEGFAPFPPAFDDGTLVVGDPDEQVVAVDDDGERLWRREIPVASPATIADGRAYLAGFGGEGDDEDTHRVYALDLDTGETLWREPVAEAWRGRAFTVDDDAVYYQGAGAFHARDRATGEHLWRFHPENALEYESARAWVRRGQPARTDAGLYVGGAVVPEGTGQRAMLARLDPATGELLSARAFEDATNSTVRGGLAVADGWVYARSPSTRHLFGVSECALGALGRCLY